MLWSSCLPKENSSQNYWETGLWWKLARKWVLLKKLIINRHALQHPSLIPFVPFLTHEQLDCNSRCKLFHAVNILSCAEPVCAVGFGVAAFFSAIDKQSQQWSFREYSLTAVSYARLLEFRGHHHRPSKIKYQFLVPARALL